VIPILNYIWGGMILLAIVVAAFTGNIPALTNAAIESAREAVMLCITILGVLSMWTGLLTVADRAGMVKTLSRKLKPTLRYLFPELGRNHPAHEPIATNFIANILGLGWAATPSGIMAMKALQKDNPSKDTATKSMRMFMVINMSSLQLVTISVVAYRTQYGSANPSEIIGPGLIITMATTVIAVAFCKVLERFNL